ncbi:MAG TPA: hypothetical protein VF828_00940 [Patescibacteria group bacterium]
MAKKDLCPRCIAEGRSVCKFKEEVQFIIFRARRAKGEEGTELLYSLPKRIDTLREEYRWGPFYCRNTNLVFDYPTPPHPQDFEDENKSAQ